jgi:1-acyl-sn-glycerol-3-phosphate acyltransferase
MTRFFISIYTFLSAHKRITSVGLIVLIAVLAVMTLHINYEEDIAKFLPRNEQNEQYQDIYEQISAQNKIAVIFTSKDSTQMVDDDSLEMAMDFVGKELAKNKTINHLQVTINDEKIAQMMDFVYQNMPYFLTEEDYKRIDSLLAKPDYIKNQMLQNRQLLMMPMGGTMMQTVKYDPLHLFTPVLKRLQNFSLSDQFQLVDGYVFTKDGRHAMLTFDSPYGSSETKRNAMLSEGLDSIISKAEAHYPNLHISAIGAPLIAVTNAHQIKQDAIVAVSIAVVLILFLLIRHYRRWADILWIVVSIAFGWMFALAGMSLFHESVSIIVLGIGSVIIGIAVNYPLHFLDHIRDVHDRKEALREMIPPLFIGNITTVAAFLCLIWLDAQAMRDLGLFGSLMLIGTILFVLVFLPLYAKNGMPLQKTVVYKVKGHCLQGKQPLFIVLLIVVSIVLGYFSLQTSFDSNLQHINYMTKSQRQDMRFLSSSVKEEPVYAVAEGKNLEEAVRQNDQLMARLKGVDSIREVKGIGAFLMSEKTQDVRLSHWKDFSQRYLANYSNTFNEVCKQFGFSSEAFSAYSNLFNHPYKKQSIAYFKPVYEQLGANFILHDKTGVKIVNYVYTSAEDKVKQAVSLAFSSKDISNQLVKVLNNSFNYIGFVCGFVVFFFLWVSFGSLELSLLSFLPLAVSWIWILGLMQVFGIQFNIVNIILATFIFGQGDDYTIFITEGLMYEYATGKKRLGSYKNSVVFSAILMFIGIGCLVFAKHPALRSLGAVTVIGMITVVVMAYYLPPLVFHWMTMKNGKRRAVPVTLKRLAYSVYSLLVFLGIMYCFMLPYTWLYFHFGKTTEEKKLRYHRLIQRMSAFIIRHVPGVKYSQKIPAEKDFLDKPAVIVCNHQSHFDLMCLLQLSPKIVFVTNDWVWHNPFYGAVIHRAEFYPVSDGIEQNMPRLRDLYERGYSICVFPEGTRSEDCSILRFHKGAFYLARELQTDILPVFLHGAGHALPKRDFMLREGSIYMEVGERIPLTADPSVDANEQDRRFTHQIRQYYKEHYAALCQQLEDEEYWKPYRKYEQMYKGDFK